MVSIFSGCSIFSVTMRGLVPAKVAPDTVGIMAGFGKLCQVRP